MASSATHEYLDQFAETVSDNLGRPFTVSGRRGYLVGHMDGAFPDLGHHIPGEMGGLWAPPVKLVDGWWFGLKEAGSESEWEWLFGKNARRFTMSPGRASGEFTVKIGEAEVTATEEIFMAAHESSRSRGRLSQTNPTISAA